MNTIACLIVVIVLCVTIRNDHRNGSTASAILGCVLCAVFLAQAILNVVFP